MKDEQGSILIEGFMDGSGQPTEKDMEIIAGLPFDRENLKNLYGVPSFGLDRTGTTRSSTSCPRSPSTDYLRLPGEGLQTINPAKAS